MKDARTRSEINGRPLRRFREVVCFTIAALLWLLAWRVERGGFGSRLGELVLAALGVLEALWLLLVFWREQATERDVPTPWITVAWASLPAWCALQLLIGSLLSRG